MTKILGVSDAHLSPAARAAWDRNLAVLDAMRAAVEATRRFAEQPDTRAKAYHALLEAEAFAYNFAVAPRLAVPRVSSATAWQTEVYALGNPSQDFVYSTTFLDGRQSYRLTGNRGDGRVLLAQLYNGLPGTAGFRRVAEIDLHRLPVDRDGQFWLDIGPPGSHAGLELDAGHDLQWLLFRRGVVADGGALSNVRVDMVNDPSPSQYHRDEFDDVAIAWRIDRATDILRFVVEQWVIGRYDRLLDAAGGSNTLAFVPDDLGDTLGAACLHHLGGIFEHAADEALIVTLGDMSDDATWSIQLADVWSRALEFRTRQTGLNASQAAADPDGKIRLVIAGKDPGAANWLDSSGRAEGQLALHVLGPRPATVPTIARVPLAQVSDFLPTATRMTAPEARQADLERRRERYWQIYGE